MTVSNVHHFVIEPKKGVGPIRFGMHSDEVSKTFTYVYTNFFKLPWSQVRSDHCEVVGLIPNIGFVLLSCAPFLAPFAAHVWFNLPLAGPAPDRAI